MYPAHFNELMKLVKEREPQIAAVRRLMQRKDKNIYVPLAQMFESLPGDVIRGLRVADVKPNTVYRLMADIARFLVDNGIEEVEEEK